MKKRQVRVACHFSLRLELNSYDNEASYPQVSRILINTISVEQPRFC